MCNHAWKCNASSCWKGFCSFFRCALAGERDYLTCFNFNKFMYEALRVCLAFCILSIAFDSVVYALRFEWYATLLFSFFFLFVSFLFSLLFSLWFSCFQIARMCVTRDDVSTRMKFRVANSANRKANADSIRVLNRRDREFVDIWRDRMHIVDEFIDPIDLSKVDEFHLRLVCCVLAKECLGYTRRLLLIIKRRSFWIIRLLTGIF